MHALYASYDLSMAVAEPLAMRETDDNNIEKFDVKIYLTPTPGFFGAGVCMCTLN